MDCTKWAAEAAELQEGGASKAISIQIQRPMGPTGGADKGADRGADSGAEGPIF